MRILLIIYLGGIVFTTLGALLTYPKDPERRNWKHISMEIAAVLTWPIFVIFVAFVLGSDRK
jgi:hypothetical protein